MTGRTASTRRTIFPERGVHLAPGFWLLPTIALLAAPARLFAAVLLAAALHELGHAAALGAFRVPIEGIRLGALGAVIYARGAARLSYGRELAVTLAGPAVNLLCAPLAASLALRFGWEWGYLFAGAHMLLGVYNLLPISPLDGSRALWLLAAYRRGPYAADRLCAAVGTACALALCALGAYLALRGCGALLLLAALGLLFQQFGLAKRALCV